MFRQNFRTQRPYSKIVFPKSISTVHGKLDRLAVFTVALASLAFLVVE
jgi:hypothetical protein